MGCPALRVRRDVGGVCRSRRSAYSSLRASERGDQRAENDNVADGGDVVEHVWIERQSHQRAAIVQTWFESMTSRLGAGGVPRGRSRVVIELRRRRCRRQSTACVLANAVAAKSSSSRLPKPAG